MIPVIPIGIGLGLLWLLSRGSSSAAPKPPPGASPTTPLGTKPPAPTPKPNLSDVEDAPTTTGGTSPGAPGSMDNVSAGSISVNTITPQRMAYDFTGDPSRWRDLQAINPHVGPIVSSASVVKDWADGGAKIMSRELDLSGVIGAAVGAGASGGSGEGGPTIEADPVKYIPKPSMEFPETYKYWHALYVKGGSVNIPWSWKK